MPPNLESVQAIGPEGVAAIYVPADVEGHLVPVNKGRTIVHVKNAGITSVTLTIKGGLVAGANRYLSDRTVAIAGDSEKTVRLSLFDVRADGQAEITFSATSDVSFALLVQRNSVASKTRRFA